MDDGKGAFTLPFPRYAQQRRLIINRLQAIQSGVRTDSQGRAATLLLYQDIIAFFDELALLAELKYVVNKNYKNANHLELAVVGDNEDKISFLGYHGCRTIIICREFGRDSNIIDLNLPKVMHSVREYFGDN